MAAPVIQFLKNADWKILYQTVIKLLSDLKIAGMLLLFFFILYAIGYDTVFRPSMEQLKSLDESLKQQKDAVSLKKQENEKYRQWSQELKGLQTRLISVGSNQVPTVVAAGQLGRIENLLLGKTRGTKDIEPLPSPHDKPKEVSIKQLAVVSVTLPSLDSPEAAPENPSAKMGRERVQQKATAAVPLNRYDYEARVVATLPYLVDMVNQLTLENDLVVIRDVSLTPFVIEQPNPQRPDPKIEPDSPVPVEMLLTLSIYMASSDKPAESVAPSLEENTILQPPATAPTPSQESPKTPAPPQNASGGNSPPIKR